MEVLMLGLIGASFCASPVQAQSYPSFSPTPLNVDLDLNSKILMNIGDIVVKGPWVDVRSYSSIADAVTAAAGKTLLITNAQTVSSTLTIGSNVNVVTLNGGYFSVANGATLTINGPFSAPYAKVFNCSGTGAVKFGASSVAEVYPEWWGAKGDSNLTAGNGTDSTLALQAAADAGIDDGTYRTQRTVKLLPGKYRITSELTIPARVSICGAGVDTTIIYGNNSNINVFVLNGTGKNYIENLTVYKNGATSGAAIKVKNGNVADLYVTNLKFLETYISVSLASSSCLTHSKFSNCRFEYNVNDCFKIEDNVEINSIEFDSCRFEETSGRHYSAVGNTIAHGGVKFINCVFESSHASASVDLGNNARGYTFIGCHFEYNAHGSISDGTDILIGAGSGAITIQGCVFSSPYPYATGFYDIKFGSPAAGPVSISNNYFTATPGTTSGYSGAIKSGGANQRQITISNNFYNGSSGNYLSSDSNGIYTLMDKPNNNGFASEGIFAFIQTTNSTPTPLWRYTYCGAGADSARAFYVIADIVGIDDTGTNVAAYTLRTLVSQTGTNNLTTKGSANEVSIETDSALDCSFISSTDSEGTLYLKVTGLNGSIINWAASIKIVSVKF